MTIAPTDIAARPSPTVEALPPILDVESIQAYLKVLGQEVFNKFYSVTQLNGVLVQGVLDPKTLVPAGIRFTFGPFSLLGGKPYNIAHYKGAIYEAKNIPVAIGQIVGKFGFSFTGDFDLSITRANVTAGIELRFIDGQLNLVKDNTFFDFDTSIKITGGVEAKADLDLILVAGNVKVGARVAAQLDMGVRANFEGNMSNSAEVPKITLGNYYGRLDAAYLLYSEVGASIFSFGGSHTFSTPTQQFPGVPLTLFGAIPGNKAFEPIFLEAPPHSGQDDSGGAPPASPATLPNTGAGNSNGSGSSQPVTSTLPPGAPVAGGVSSSEELTGGVYSSGQISHAPPGSIALAPADQTVVNGDFSNIDPVSSDFGWQAGPHVTYAGHHALLDESTEHSTDLTQAFILPANARALRFTIDSLSLHNNDARNLPPDAFEVTMLDDRTGLPLFTADGLPLTDALFNIQYDGRVFFSRQTLMDGAVATGEALNPSLHAPLTVTIDLRDLPASTPIRLVFTLIGFGDNDSSVSIDDVALLGEAPLPPRINLSLDPAFDSGAAGDLLTNRAVGRLIGKTEALQQVLLDVDGDGFDDGSAIADANGNFAFDNVAFAPGVDNFRVRATNASGATFATLQVTRDSIAPPLSLNLASASDTAPADDATTINVVDLVGFTDPFQTVTLDQTGATVTADNTGRFTFTQIPLSLGANSFALHATDAAGNASALTRTFTRLTPDTTAPALSAALAVDTGSSNADGYTSNAAVIGSAVDDSLLSSLALSVDNGPYVSILDLVKPDGSFALMPARLAQALGLAVLPDGSHTLRFKAIDNQNNTSDATLTFTLDTTAPALTFNLDGASDTAPIGDLRTTLASVNIAGVTDRFATWSLAASTLHGDADFDGLFNFGPVALAPGVNTFTITAVDLAGNIATFTRSFTRFLNETVPPVISAALAHDNGISNTDGITNDPTVQGLVTDDSPIASFRAGFDSAAPASYVSLLGDLSPTNSFTLSRSRLEEIYDNILPDGVHTLHFIAVDAFGNSSTFDLAFTLNTAAPRFVDPATVNSGNAQRSHIDQIELTFNRDVFASIDLGDFRLVDSASHTVSLSAATFRRGGSANSIILDLHNVALADGDYDLRLIPNSITDFAGNSLDVDGDGIGDAHTGKFAITSFHKLAGDADGNRTVNALDLLLVRKTLGKSIGQPGFDPNGELNGDGIVDANDSNIASVNQGHAVTAVSSPALVILENSLTPNDRAVDFGTVNKTLSDAIDVTIRNDGQKPLTIASIQIVGVDAASFQLEVIGGGFTPTSGMTLNAGETRIIRVRMTTFTAGAKSAVLRFWHNDPSQAAPASVTLTGIAAALPAGVAASETTVPVSSTVSSTASSLGGISSGATIVPSPATAASKPVQSPLHGVATPKPVMPKNAPRPAAKTSPRRKTPVAATNLFNTKNAAKAPTAIAVPAKPSLSTAPLPAASKSPFASSTHKDLKTLLS